jgi:hypothetical protein
MRLLAAGLFSGDVPGSRDACHGGDKPRRSQEASIVHPCSPGFRLLRPGSMGARAPLYYAPNLLS